MTLQFGSLAGQPVADGRIGPEQIAVLRQLGWAQGQITADDAESLFATNDALGEATPEWQGFFVEALANFIVNTVDPHGAVDQELADALVARVDSKGRVNSLAELELLVRVLELAKSSPASLRTYALWQIAAAVEQGDGPTRYGAATRTGINSAEVALLRRILGSTRADGPAKIGLAEARLLFQIKDACLNRAIAPEWQDLFVRNAAEYLLGFAGPEALDDARAAELEAFMQAEGAAIGGFLLRSLAGETASSGMGLDTAGELDEQEQALIAFIGAATADAAGSVKPDGTADSKDSAAPIIAQGNLTGHLGQGNRLALCAVTPWGVQLRG